MSDQNSRNYATFRANLERLRNESLRLNKGVQTEGDSERAWNELIASDNDPQVVLQRLKDVRALNRRGRDFREASIQTRRQTYGMDPLDMTSFVVTRPAVGSSVAEEELPSQRPSGSSRRRFNPQTGKIE